MWPSGNSQIGCVTKIAAAILIHHLTATLTGIHCLHPYEWSSFICSSCCWEASPTVGKTFHCDASSQFMANRPSVFDFWSNIWQVGLELLQENENYYLLIFGASSVVWRFTAVQEESSNMEFDLTFSLHI